MANPWEEYQSSADEAGPWSEHQVTPPKESAGPGVTEDIAKAVPSGLARGAAYAAGAPGDVRDLVGTGVEWLANKLGYPLPMSGADFMRHATPAMISSLPTSKQLQGGIETVTGPLYEAKTTPGKYAQTISEFAPAAVAGPGGIARRVLGQTVIPAVSSETAGQLTEGTEAEPYARAAGALAGPGIAAGLRRAVTPFPIAPERQAMLDVLHQEGVPVTAGQATGRKPLQWFESALGDLPFTGGRAAEMAERQGEQFTGAAMRRAGENTTRAGSEEIDRAFTRIGGNFDRLAARNNMTMDVQLGNDLSRLQRGYNSLVNESARAPIVADTIRDIGNIAANSGGVMDGAAYQALRSRLDKAARDSRSDPQLSGALFDMRNSLDAAMERSIRPADRAAWRNARREYRNLMVLENAATGAGENAALGLISPAKLRQAAVAQNRRAYARGEGDFADLARAGEAIMKPMPQSGTAPRSYAQSLPTVVGAGLGGILGHGVEGAGAGAIAALAGPPIAGRMLMNPLTQRYLANQLLLPTPQGDARLRALLLAQAARSGVSGTPQVTPDGYPYIQAQ